LALNEIVELVWYRVFQIPVSMTKKCTKKTRHTIIYWNNFCRDVAIAMINKRIGKGGLGQIVQIDKSLFQDKRK